MEINKLKEMSFDELRMVYKGHLQKLNISKSTISTAYTDTFYLWRHCGSKLFWDVVLSSDFEIVAKKFLIEALSERTSGNSDSLVNGYVSHLRRFRSFIVHNNEHIISDIAILPIKLGTSVKREVPLPSVEQVEYYLDKWKRLENYTLQEEALNKLFHKLCPQNEAIEDILLKCSTLNDFYSTNIFSIYPVAQHILNLHIDRRLFDGDETLVDDIKIVKIGDKTKNFYSFATKYCSHHNPKDYPIYDSYVDAVLKYFKVVSGFSNFSSSDLKNYSCFKNILCEFKKFYKLDNYNLKQIDQYLWQLGKDYFPKRYK